MSYFNVSRQNGIVLQHSNKNATWCKNACLSESQKQRERAREWEREIQPESKREHQRKWEPWRDSHGETQIFSLNLSNSLRLSWISLPLFGFLWLFLALPLALSNSLWLCLALSDFVWIFGSLSPDMLIETLLGSQGPCSARSVATVLQHLSQLW